MIQFNINISKVGHIKVQVIGVDNSDPNIAGYYAAIEDMIINTIYLEYEWINYMLTKSYFRPN